MRMASNPNTNETFFNEKTFKVGGGNESILFSVRTVIQNAL